jgi:hypothetical protein
MTKPQPSAKWNGDCPIVGASLPRKPPMSESTLTRSRRCGQSAACRCSTRPTPRLRSAMACRRFQTLPLRLAAV